MNGDVNDTYLALAMKGLVMKELAGKVTAMKDSRTAVGWVSPAQGSGQVRTVCQQKASIAQTPE